MAGSILETFFLLFESNSDTVKKGNEDAKKSSDDLDQSLNTTDRAGIAMGEHLVGALKDVAIAFAAAFSVEKIAEVISATADYNATLAINSDRLGVSVEDLSAWGRAIEHAGGSSDGLIGTLDFLNKGLAGLNTPGGVSRLKPFLEELKIDPHKITTSLSLLELLADKSKQLGAQKFAGIAERFGLDPGTQLLLAKGKTQLLEQIQHEKDLGVTTRENAEEARKYKQALDDLSHQFDRLATGVLDKVLPSLISFIDWIGKTVDYLGKHKGLIEGFFSGVAVVVLTLYTPAIVAAAEATWTLLAPILAVVGPILAVGVAIALVTDDVQNFLAGNKSVIGELSKKWPELGETVRAATKTMSEAWDTAVNTFKTGRDVIVAGHNLIETSFSKTGEAAKEYGKKQSEAFDKIPAWVNLVKELTGWLQSLEKVLQELGVIGSQPLKLPNEPADSVVNITPKWLRGSLPDALESLAKQFNVQTEKLGGTPTPLEGANARDSGASPIPDRPIPGGSFTIARPQPVVPIQAPVFVFDKVVQEGIKAAQAHITLANNLPVASVQSHINNQKQGDKSFKFSIEKMVFQTDYNDLDKYAKAAAVAIEREFRQAIAHYDDGVKG